MIVMLRRATSRHHADIERLLQLDSPFTLDRYIQVLQGFDFFLREWEPCVEASLPPQLGAWAHARRRGPMARDDLAALGASRLEGRAGLPALDSASAALGSLYVLEGSALGGQVIARQVQAQHGLSEKNGAAYFNGWGIRTGAHWREFQAVLAQHDTKDACREEACQAATETFEALGHAYRSATRATT